jgi:acetate kinase
VRELTCQGLEFLGAGIDPERNNGAIGKEMVISRDDARVKILAIPTNEELVIARDTKNIISKS